MKLYKYEAKRIFSKEGIPIPRSIPITTCDDGEDFFSSLGKAILKAQVLSGGRGKLGIIKKVTTLSDIIKKSAKNFSVKLSMALK